MDIEEYATVSTTYENSSSISEPGVLDSIFGPRVNKAICDWADPIMDFINSYQVGPMPDGILELLAYKRELWQLCDLVT